MKKVTKQILKNMIYSNVEFCDNSENETLHKYKQVFKSVMDTNKHKTYAPTLRNLQKNMQQIIQHILN